MALNFFPIQSSILSPDALLSEINFRYGLNVLKCRLWSSGLNDVYLIQETTRKYFLRTSHTIRFLKRDYEEELNVILQLRSAGINTCIPVKQLDETYIWEINAPEGKRYAVLFDEIKNDKTVSTYNMGKLAAEIHKASDDVILKISRQPISYEQLISHPLKSIIGTDSMNEKDTQSIVESSTQMWNDLISHIPDTAPYYGYCHGDMHSGNVYFTGGIPQIFDFDCMGIGYRVYDLCVYLWDETSVNEEFINSEEWKNYLKGYNEVRILSKAEIISIPAFAALRQLWFIGLIIDATKINNSWDGLNNSFFEEHLKRYKFWYEKWKSDKDKYVDSCR
jgi:Ser/Thr protein kinase RdoA (MazF antagonist)